MTIGRNSTTSNTRCREGDSRADVRPMEENAEQSRRPSSIRQSSGFVTNRADEGPEAQELKENSEGAASAGTPEQSEPLLSLEDRLLVALAGRGQMSICDFLWRAFDHDPIDDDALIETLEQYAEQARDLLRGNG